jgi:hypothetical protein
MGPLSKSAAAAAALTAALASLPSARAFNLTITPRNTTYSYGLALTGDGRGECHDHKYKCSLKRPLCEVSSIDHGRGAGARLPPLHAPGHQGARRSTLLNCAAHSRTSASSPLATHGHRNAVPEGAGLDARLPQVSGRVNCPGVISAVRAIIVCSVGGPAAVHGGGRAR